MDNKLTAEEVCLVEAVQAAMAGEEAAELPSLKEFIATPSAQVIIPTVVVGAARKAAEPLYLGTKLLKRVRMKQTGNMVTFPSFGVIRAYDVPEGAEIPAEHLDWQTHQGTEVRVGKSGVRIPLTQEEIDDSQWDVVAMHIEAAGRALARHKEEKIFKAFSSHGHVVFDNAIRAAHPEAGTNGLAADGTLNDTLAPEDILDMIVALMANGFTPTDILLHPLTWAVFARNEVLGRVSGGVGSDPAAATQSFKLGPESIQGRFPFALSVLVSPFVPFDTEKKVFDMYAVDRNNIGVLLVKQDLKMDDFVDPMRDIRNIKLTERYGVGILNEGRAVAVARNIKFDASYPRPMLVRQV